MPLVIESPSCAGFPQELSRRSSPGGRRCASGLSIFSSPIYSGFSDLASCRSFSFAAASASFSQVLAISRIAALSLAGACSANSATCRARSRYSVTVFMRSPEQPCIKSHFGSGDTQLRESLRRRGKSPFHVAFMSRGDAGTPSKPLKTHDTTLRHTRHEKGHLAGGRFQQFFCNNNVVGEVGLEPTKS